MERGTSTSTASTSTVNVRRRHGLTRRRRHEHRSDRRRQLRRPRAPAGARHDDDGTSAFGAGLSDLRGDAAQSVLPRRATACSHNSRARRRTSCRRSTCSCRHVPEQAGRDAGRQLCGAERGCRAVAREESFGQRRQRDRESRRAGHDVRRPHQSARRSVAKTLKLGRSRTLVGVDVYNALNSSAVLTYNNTFVPGGTWLQPLTILTPRFFKFTAEITSDRMRRPARSPASRAIGCGLWRSSLLDARRAGAARPRRKARSRFSSCTRPGGMRRSPPSASASCRGSSTTAWAGARLLLGVHRHVTVSDPGTKRHFAISCA